MRRPGLLVLASDCDWCYTLQNSLRYAAFGGHVHTLQGAAGATYFILHLTVNQGSDGLLGACLITTYDCDYNTNIYEGITYCAGIVGYGLASVMYDTRLGATALTVVLRTTMTFWYLGACLMIVTISFPLRKFLDMQGLEVLCLR